MRKIAERIEYSPAAIYSYFPSKDDIFFALAEEGFRLLASCGGAACAQIADPFDRVRGGLWAFYQFSKTHPEYFDLMFVDRSVPSLNQDFQRFEFFQETTALFEADIQACIERGQFSKRLNPAAALCGWACSAPRRSASLIARPGRRPRRAGPRPARNDARRIHNRRRLTFVASIAPSTR
jgi:AcrR family transcriptional regulator